MEVAVECKCGTWAGVVIAKPTTGCRAICLCDDCQAYAHFLGRADDVLDANGGTSVFPLAPAQLKMTRGQDQLRCVRLSANGMYRWYTACCKTPIGNTPANLKLPYLGLVHSVIEKKNSPEVLDKYFGSIYARIQGKFGIPPLPEGTLQRVSAGFMLRVVSFLLMVNVLRLKKPSPFFNSQGQPLAGPQILTQEQREKLRTKLHAVLV